MHWKVVTHFLRSKRQPWIHSHVTGPHHSFDVVPARYDHDRSRERTSARQWLDMLCQAARAWLGAAMPWRATPVGFVAVFPPLAVCLGLLKRLTGSRAPIVAWSFNLSRRFEGWQARLARFALASVDVFVVFSRREIETYSAMLGLPRERFVFVPFTEELVEPAAAEEPDAPFILALGTANRDYGTMLEAVGRLGLRTVIVAGPHAVAGKFVPPNVEVRSGLSLGECHTLCQQARVNVVPLDTVDTASGQVTVRYAMMFGKAVVATTSIGTEDYLEDGVTGTLVPPHDADAMAAAIGELWHDAAKRSTMGEAARAWLQEHAAYEVGPARLGELVERLRLRQGRGRAPAAVVAPGSEPVAA